MARDFSGSGQYIDLGVLSASFAVPYTISAWINADDVTTGTIIAGWRNNGGRIAFQLQIGGSSKLSIIHGESAFTVAEQTGLTTGTWIHILGTMTSGRTGQAFVNGSGGATNSAGNALSANPTNKAGIGGYHDSGIGFVGLNNGRIAEVAFWTDVLTQDEITSLASAASPLLVRPSKLLAYWPLLARTTNEEDWCGGVLGTVTGATASEHPRVIRATSRGRYFDTGAGGTSYTLTAATGAFTETGNAANLLKGNVVLTATGSFVETGNAANLVKNSVLATAVGAFTETGNDANLTKQWALVTSVGSFVFTGNDATLDYSGDTHPPLVAASGSYTLTGNAAGLAHGWVLTTEVGTFVETGNAANLKRGNSLVADTSSFTLTGNAASLVKTYVLTTEVGTFILTGRNANLIWSGAGGSTVEFFRGVSKAPDGGVSKIIHTLVDGGGGTYVVTESSGVSEDKTDSPNYEGYIIT